MNSMTGYAHGEFDLPSLRFSLEIKSYNNRYLDISIQLPSYLGALEPRLRSSVQERVRRGKVELSLRVREIKVPVTVNVDKKAAAAGVQALRGLSELIGVSGDLRISDLLRLEGILSMERDIETDDIWTEIQPALQELFLKFGAERSREGENLKKDILSQIGKVKAGLEVVSVQAPEIERMVKENLRRRFQEVLGNLVDENRVLQETAVTLMRYTVNEEIIRLRSHLEAFAACMASESEPGKKIDFICQEMNREVNTIGSKSQISEIGLQVVLMKEAVENIREQARNIE
jgi:uncharacterized protein (TIGR00255 family)